MTDHEALREAIELVKFYDTLASFSPGCTQSGKWADIAAQLQSISARLPDPNARPQTHGGRVTMEIEVFESVPTFARVWEVAEQLAEAIESKTTNDRSGFAVHHRLTSVTVERA